MVTLVYVVYALSLSMKLLFLDLLAFLMLERVVIWLVISSVGKLVQSNNRSFTALISKQIKIDSQVCNQMTNSTAKDC
jgi:hypothetical protein